jgi:hypothetical protein
MKAADLNRAQSLLEALDRARRVHAEFEAVKSDTVPSFAFTEGSDFRMGARIELLRIPKNQAVSAAARVVSKIEAELESIGVVLTNEPVQAVARYPGMGGD